MKFKITQGRGEETVSFKSREEVERYVQENYTATLGTVKIEQVGSKSKPKVKIDWKR